MRKRIKLRAKIFQVKFKAKLNTGHSSWIKPLVFLLKNLNDMNAFANAWHVDVRFIQGDYFQKRMDHLTDVQDQ